MRVVHAQAERILAEFKKLEGGVPGFSKAQYKLGSPDEHGHADLELEGNHASPEAFANAAGIFAASPPAPKLKCIAAPQIIGLPNVGQHVTASAGVWEEPDPERLGDPGTTPSGTVVRWLYDRNENDPVVIPEGDPHGYGSGGGRDLLIPSAALGKTMTLRVTRGATTVYSDGFGPIGGGLTEYTFPAAPVLDRDVVGADPGGRRQDGSSATARKPRSSSQTPTSGRGSVGKAGAAAVKASPPPKPVSKSKKDALAKRAAKDTKPKPATDPVSE